MERLGVVALGIQQQRGQPAAATLSLAGLVGLHAQIALDDVGGQRVAVDEDPLGQRDHRRSRDAHLGRDVGGGAPGRARAGAEGLAQSIERAPGLELRLAQPPPHLVGLPRRRRAALDRVEERVQRLLDAQPDPHPGGVGQDLGVDRILGPDRRHDLVDQTRQVAPGPPPPSPAAAARPTREPPPLSHCDKTRPKDKLPKGGDMRRGSEVGFRS